MAVRLVGWDRFWRRLTEIMEPQPRRTCWAWCDCGRDLNGDDDSFVSNNGDVVTYRCARCGDESRWLFNAPTPIRLRSDERSEAATQ